MFSHLVTSLLSASLLLLASCSVETKYDDTPRPGNPDTPETTPRCEVLLTLKNTLSATHSVRGIATTQENTLSTLDVYVFGSRTEEGPYTLQQRFAYRDDASGLLPVNAEELQLDIPKDDGAGAATALLRLKRGLFVKLYCIANDTLPVNPATGKPLASKDLVPITFNKAGEDDPIAREGYPTEKEFVTFHTRLLTGKTGGKNEVLLTPLAMSGALTTPLDLTEAAGAARRQVSFRLTRLAARFDIVNDEEASRFTIQSVSLGNGRRGSGFFPIAVTGAIPAGKDDLVTYTARDFIPLGFENPDANKGLSQGAFYCYSSPQEDEGYLILRGLYRVNKTETREVSYQVPFRRKEDDGTETYIGINPNHRYTVGITAADEYRLDFTLSVADWDDEGSIDDYEPQNKPGEITITIPDAYKNDTQDEYDEKRHIHTVSMSLAKGSYFTAKVGATSPLQVTKTYAGGAAGKKYDWLQISDPSITRLGGSEYAYTFSLTDPYTLGRYPRCTVRIFDSLSGEESIIYVDALSVPQPVEAAQPLKAPNNKTDNPNTYDPENAAVSMYRIKNSRAVVALTCPDGLEVASVPQWLKLEQESEENPRNTYALTLKTWDVSEESGEVVFKNKKRELKAAITVSLVDAPIKPDFKNPGEDNKYVPPTAVGTPATVEMLVKDGNRCTVPVTSLGGVEVKMDFDGGPEWLTTGAASVSGKNAGTAGTARNSGNTGTLPFPALTGKEAAAAKKAAMDAARGITTYSDRTGVARDAGPKTQTDNITFSLVNDRLAGAKPVTVTLVNTIEGPDSTFVIKPVLELGTLEKAASVPVDDVISEEGGTKKLTLYKLPKTESYITVEITSYGGSTLTSDDDTILKVEKTTKPVTSKGARATSSADQTDNVAYYKLTALKAGTTTLKHCNHTDNTKFEEYAVEVVASDITTTVDNLVVLTAENGKTATATLSSPKGFTASITDYDVKNGGTLWMGLQKTHFEGGENVQLIALANAQTGKVRPVTVTLANKIKDGGDLTLTFTPEAVMPVIEAVANTASPKQNVQDPKNKTVLKLYQVQGSKISFKASSIGGTQITGAKGVTLTDPAGKVTPSEGTYDTDYIYTVTLNDKATGGSFTIVNKLHPEKSTAITVNAPATLTTAPTDKSLNAWAGQYVDNTVNFPEGFTASVTDKTGSSHQWFKLVNNKNAATTSFGSGAQVVRCLMEGTNGMTMKPITVTLKNNIAGGEDRTFKVTPVYASLSAVATGTPSPTQNKALSGGKVQLYRVSNSQVQVKVTAFGGSYLKTGVNGISVTGGNTTNTDNVYTITYASGNGGNLVFAHKQDASKTLNINVVPLATVTTAPTSPNKTLAIQSSQTNATNTYNFPEGFTAKVDNWGTGGSAWFTLNNSGSFGSGSQNVTCTTIASSQMNGKTMNAVTVTLTNKISGGESKTFTVTPTFAAPTVTATGKPVPSMNENLSGGWIKLYEMPSGDSYVQVSVTAYGGSKIKSVSSGLNVVAQSGTTDKTTTRTYTVSRGTYKGTNGYVIFANGHDASKEYRVNVKTAPALTVTQTATTVNAATSGTTQIATVTSDGCTVSVTSWGGGNSDWFTFPSSIASGENQVFSITQVSGNTSKIMKAATVRFTMGSVTKDITVTPANFTAPTLSASSGSDTDYYLNTTQTTTFTVTSAGAAGTPSSSNTGVATVSRSGNTVTVTTKGVGTATITIPNGSDNNKKSTYTFSVSASRTYDGAYVYKDPKTGFYIAPSDAGSGRWESGKPACSGKSGGSWFLPSWDDWKSLDNSTSRAFLQNTVGLSVGSEYWSSSNYGEAYYYARFDGSSIYQTLSGPSSTRQWRCISH